MEGREGGKKGAKGKDEWVETFPGQSRGNLQRLSLLGVATNSKSTPARASSPDAGVRQGMAKQ